ncbi:MAG: PadR family transcriptional regulator [Lachnospiraceae bacterium]|nr:PadR family transcriptional regulator [Lachnospiraceae bacterium]
MAKQTRKQNNIKHGSIELVLLLLLQSGKKYGYQLAQELDEFSDGGYDLKETTMYPTLYRLYENGYLDSEQIKVGVRRTRVYYFITDSGKQRLQELLHEYWTITNAIEKIILRTSEGSNAGGNNVETEDS